MNVVGELNVSAASCHFVIVFCSDLRPANILLGDHGHILLTYFSQWNTVEQSVDDQAADSLYCAPGLCRRVLVQLCHRYVGN